MDVLALLSPLLLSHLRIVLGDANRHRLHAPDRWDEVEVILRRTPVEVAVLDPMADGGRVDMGALVNLTRRFPSLPVVIYTTLTPNSLRNVVELSRHGVTQLVLYRFDDEPGRFLELLEVQPGIALGEELIDRLRGPLAELPMELASTIEQLFRYPQRFAVADDLAASSRVPRRTLYRAVAAAGLGSPSRLVRGARLLQAFAYLHDAGHSLEDVAVKCGFSSRQLFARHVRDAFGLRPRELRRKLTPAEFVEILAASLTAPVGVEEG